MVRGRKGKTGFEGTRQKAPPELYRRPHWFACCTRARAEKRVDRYLAGSGIEAYLPLIERERRWADRRKRVALPLFPGYIFARFRMTEMGDVFRAPGLVSVVRVAGYPTPVREEELESVRALVEGANRTGVEPQPSEWLVVGQRVRVVEGPFRGMRGTLVQGRGRGRVVVRLGAIRQAVGVEMDRRVLRPAGEAEVA